MKAFKNSTELSMSEL